MLTRTESHRVVVPPKGQGEGHDPVWYELRMINVLFCLYALAGSATQNLDIHADDEASSFNKRTAVHETYTFFRKHESVTYADTIMVLGALHPDATGSEAW